MSDEWVYILGLSTHVFFPSFCVGLGWAMVVISGLVAIYYNMIIAYTLYYTFVSFTSKVPWQDCRPEWIEKYNCQERGAVNATQRNLTSRQTSMIYITIYL